MWRADSLLSSVRLAVVCLLVPLSVACGHTCPPVAGAASWPPTPDDAVVGAAADVPSRLQADVYVDGTVSMQGFVASNNSRYVRFLRDIEATVTSAWPSSDVRTFKFGTKVRELDHQEFLRASVPSFYSEPGLAESTAIDAVLAQAEAARLSIVITDLFQTAGDVTAMTVAIRNRFLQKRTAVAVLAVPSEFDGKVYDAKVPSYPYRTAGDPATFRPFYALLFGGAADIERLMAVMSRQDYVRPDLFLLTTVYVAKDAGVRTRGDGNLNDLSGSGDFDFQRPDAPARLKAEVTRTPRPGAPAFDVAGLDLTVEEFAACGVGWTKTSQVKLAGISGTPEHFTVALEVPPLTTKGKYEYRATLRLPSVNAYQLPKWIKDWNSDNPTPAEGPNRTLNLEMFAANLLQSSTAIEAPIVARFRFGLQP